HPAPPSGGQGIAIGCRDRRGHIDDVLLVVGDDAQSEIIEQGKLHGSISCARAAQHSAGASVATLTPSVPTAPSAIDYPVIIFSNESSGESPVLSIRLTSHPHPKRSHQ